jgi:hypothetical protein
MATQPWTSGVGNALGRQVAAPLVRRRRSLAVLRIAPAPAKA